MGYWQDHPEVVKVFDDLDLYKDFCRHNGFKLMKKISTKMQVVLGELLRIETIIRKRFVKNLTNGETR